jgi:hypothetical protein
MQNCTKFKGSVLLELSHTDLIRTFRCGLEVINIGEFDCRLFFERFLFRKPV